MMSAKWSWIFGIATAAALILGVVFFAATQQITGRDVAVLIIGGIAGATIASFVAALLFHSDHRRDAMAEVRAREARLTSLIEALPTRSDQLAVLRGRRNELEQGVVQATREIQINRTEAQEYLNPYLNMRAQAISSTQAAEQWEIEKRHREEELTHVRAELDRLTGISDDEWIDEQRRARGLNGC